ncbi:alpha-amylase family protein [Pelagibacterium nitratireducens]|uniref:Alpha-amylase family protein n=1 Tax=Pelagibacterium nitratireducens TaxID=1046114 RepID=A0ABZ2I0D1_9HYPH
MDDPHWYKNAIVYALDVEKFYDSNDDGIGDLPGATEKLPYLADLGITVVWLLPIYPSPRRDNGYDISNYYDIDPRFGTTEDLIALVRRAGELGLQVIMDLVVNHTSDQHPWFKASRLDSESGYRDFYVWSSAPPPPPPGHATMFPGSEDSVWTFDDVAQSYYFHRFYHFEPELNLRNERVRQAICDIADYWLSFGIAGLRLDAAVPMIREKGQKGAIPADPHETLREIYGFMQKRKPGAVLLGEVDVEPEDVPSFFKHDVQMNLFFNFYMSNYLFLGLATEKAEVIARALDMLPPLPPQCGWANFLRNLDELDLERLDPDEREQTFASFAPKQNMRIYNRGIRRRLAPMMKGDQGRIIMAFSLLFSLPGAPMIVYGDEIGMGEDLSLPERQSVRTPMQWTSGRNGGFSNARKDRLAAPVIEEGFFGIADINVESQIENADSLRSQIRKLCHLRREHSALTESGPRLIETGDGSVLGIAYNLGERHLAILHNLSADPKMVELGPIGTGVSRLTQVAGTPCLADPDSHEIDLPAYGFGWFLSSRV